MKAIDLRVEAKQIITDIDELTGTNLNLEVNEPICEGIHPKDEGSLLQEIVLAIKATMKKENLPYLSAIQIGYRKRVFCIRYGKNDYRTYVNPAITSTKGFCTPIECCASMPDKRYLVPRFNTLKIEYMTPLGDVMTGGAYGEAAFLYQHALEHLNGGCIADYGLEVDDNWELLTDDEKAEIIKLYLEAIDVHGKKINQDIDADEELKSIKDASDFIQSVESGETKTRVEELAEHDGEVTT